MQVLRDLYESVDLKLTEAKERKPGVLAVVEGTFFVAGKPSRNKRIYPSELWEKALKNADLRRLLESRLMFGTVGHEDIDFDALIREQKVSHVVTHLELRPDGMGYGRAEILDTPVGRILKTLLESGSKLAVSSKGYGDYKESLGDGTYVVDPDSFVLERFDFVVDPGFLEAQPQLKKAYESVVRDGGKRCEEVDVVNKLLREKQMLEAKLVQMAKSVDELGSRIGELEELVERLKREREEKEKGIEEARKEKEEERSMEKREKDIEMYQRVLEREIEKLGDLIVNTFGLKEEDISAATLTGVVRKIRKVLGEKLEEKEDGDSRRVEILKKRIRALREEVERKDKLLKEASVIMRKVEELGGLKKVKEALNRSYKVMVALGNQLFKENVERLAVEEGISRKEAEKLIKKYGMKEARELLRRVSKERKDRVEGLKKVDEAKVVAVDIGVGDRGNLGFRVAKRIEEMMTKKKAETVEEIYEKR